MFCECRHCSKLSMDEDGKYICLANGDEVDPSDSAEWCSSRSITSSWGDRIDEFKEKWRNG